MLGISPRHLILRADASSGWRSADTTSSSGKGKGKVVSTGSAFKAGSRSPFSDAGASSEQTAPPEKKRRLVCGDRSSVTEPVSQGQQAPSKATMGQVRGLSGSRPSATQADAKKAAEATLEVAKVAAAMKVAASVATTKQAMVAMAAKEAMAARAKEAAAVAVTKEAAVAAAAKEVVVAMVTSEAMTMVAKVAPDAMPDPKAVVEKTVVMAESSGAGGGRPGATQVD
jgi:hypothetical protein